MHRRASGRPVTPFFSNCVKVDISFVLEFNENPALLMELVNDSSDFVRAGLLKILPKKTIKRRFKDLHIVLGVDTSMARMRPQDLERRRAKYIKDIESMTDAPIEVRRALIKLAKQVGHRG